MSRWLGALAFILCSAALASEDALRPPLTVDELRSAEFDVTLERVRELDSTPEFTAYLVAYEHSGLRLYAMIAVPRGEIPGSGFPVVLANHGYVPEPQKYGITSEGIDARPGDYYRSVPGLFASRGFVTVMPDYRGHNSSEGFEYIDPQNENSVGYYAEDVVALMSGIDQIEEADADRVFMWSHSMGGSVSLRALLATDNVRAASFWSTMNVDDLAGRLDELDGPVNVHHASGDASTPSANSESLGEALGEVERLSMVLIYPGDEHYFSGERREQAADLDATLFNQQKD